MRFLGNNAPLLTQCLILSFLPDEMKKLCWPIILAGCISATIYPIMLFVFEEYDKLKKRREEAIEYGRIRRNTLV